MKRWLGVAICTVLVLGLGGYGIHQWIFAPVPLKEVSLSSRSAPKPNANGELPEPTAHLTVEEEMAAVKPQSVSVKLSDEMIGNFPKSVTVDAGDEKFTATYTGKLTRQKSLVLFNLELYSIASYLEKIPEDRHTEALLDDLVDSEARKVYLLKFLMPLPGKQIYKAVELEINTYFTDVDVERLRGPINAFVNQFANGSNTDEMVYIVRLPGGRIYSSYNKPDDIRLIAYDKPFTRAIWRIWAGRHSGPERVDLVSEIADDSAGQPQNPAVPVQAQRSN